MKRPVKFPAPATCGNIDIITNRNARIRKHLLGKA
jgi:hypothetical protein